LFYLGGFQPPGGIDSRSGYNSRGAYPQNGARGGMYPIQPLPPLVDVFHGDGGSLGRFANTALLTSTRVSHSFFLCLFIYMNFYFDRLPYRMNLLGRSLVHVVPKFNRYVK